jgi:two-component system, cell cycle sensor histidine kinase and response regulator CckA
MSEYTTAPIGCFPGTPGGSETVLVVDDELGVRRLICETLELNGYRALAAEDGRDALSQSDAFPGEIDLLLTDIDIPDMSGRELAQCLCTARPNMRLLYTSGRDVGGILSFGVVPLGTLFLPKPFTPYGLAWRVREILDQTYAQPTVTS